MSNKVLPLPQDDSLNGGGSPGKGNVKCKAKKKTQVVVPSITVVDAEVWYHPTLQTDRDQIGKIKLKAAKQQDNLGYNKVGKLVADNANVKFYSDSRCQSQIDPFAAPVDYTFGSLCSGVTLYCKGATEGSTTLTLTLTASGNADITVLGPATGAVAAKLANVVTPKVELEYKIVLFDRKLSGKQSGGETKILPSPTYIQVSAEQTKPEIPYDKTGKLTFAPSNVDAFTDEACTKSFSRDLTADELIGAQPFKIWLRGTKEGKYNVKLTLTMPTSPKLRVDKNPSPDQEMGVVKLELKLHQQDIKKLKDAAMQVDPDTNPESTYWTNLKNKVIPDQKLMTDAEKIGKPAKCNAANPGRLLHLQGGASFGRAKLIIAKINAAHLPAGTDDYDIPLKVGRGSAKTSGNDACKSEELQGGAKDVPVSGNVAVYADEFDGAAIATPSYKISALKAAEQIVWVEGTAETDETCTVRLDAGMDRTAGGLAKTAKRNGDWTRYTVVKIDEIKVDYEAKAGKPVEWDDPKKEWYINLQEDPKGRKVKITAKLTKKFKNVTLHFMLAPDENNKKATNWGQDMPGTWTWSAITADVKHLDKKDRKDFLHLSSMTDKDGKASKELTLSRFGGDKFLPAVYIEQDPHLAKYVEGHVDLSVRKPIWATYKILVYRKFWYREVQVTGINVAGFGNAAATYADVKTEMLAAPVVQMSRANADKISPKVIYPKHMVRYYRDTNTNQYVNSYPNDTGDGLIVGDANESRFMSLVKPDDLRPVEIPIMNVHGLWIGDGPTGLVSPGWLAFNAATLSLVADKKLLDPPLQGGTLLVSGTWQAMRSNDGGATAVANSQTNGALTAGMVTLSPARSDPKAFLVAPPVTPGADVFVKVLLTLRGAASFLGTSYKDGIVNCYTPNDLVDFINTINHEIGHSFKQVTKTPPAGVPAHPNQYDKNGSHCSYTNDSCLMYEAGPTAVHLDRFCPVCHPYVLVQTMRTK